MYVLVTICIYYLYRLVACSYMYELYALGECTSNNLYLLIVWTSVCSYMYELYVLVVCNCCMNKVYLLVVSTNCIY